MNKKYNNHEKDRLIKIKDFTFYQFCCSEPRFLILKPTILLYYFGENQKIIDNFNNFTSNLDRSKFDFGIIYKEDKIVFQPEHGSSLDELNCVEYIFGHDYSLWSSAVCIYDKCKSLESIPLNDFYMEYEDGKAFKRIELSEKGKESLEEIDIAIDDIETYLSKFDVINGEIKIKYDLNELKEKIGFITKEIIHENNKQVIKLINKHTDEIFKNCVLTKK